MPDLLPIDPAVLREESLLNRRWLSARSPRSQGLRRVVTAVLATADPRSGVARLNLAALKVPAAVRVDVMRDLVTYNHFLPFVPAKRPPRGRATALSYGRPGVLAPLVSWIQWTTPAPFAEVSACVSPAIKGLLPEFQANAGRGELASAMRIPGKYASKLHRFLHAQVTWPVSVPIAKLREVVLGSKSGRTTYHKRTPDFLKFCIGKSVAIINEYSDLRVRTALEKGVEAGHSVVLSVRFEREPGAAIKA